MQLTELKLHLAIINNALESLLYWNFFFKTNISKILRLKVDYDKIGNLLKNQ